jgi:hypothetical protein
MLIRSITLSVKVYVIIHGHTKKVVSIIMKNKTCDFLNRNGCSQSSRADAKWRCNKTMMLIDEDRLQSLNGWARKETFFRIAVSSKAGRGKKKLMQDRELRRRRRRKCWLVNSSNRQPVSP